jgi:hypothetical protein
LLTLSFPEDVRSAGGYTSLEMIFFYLKRGYLKLMVGMYGNAILVKKFKSNLLRWLENA